MSTIWTWMKKNPGPASALALLAGVVAAVAGVLALARDLTGYTIGGGKETPPTATVTVPAPSTASPSAPPTTLQTASPPTKPPPTTTGPETGNSGGPDDGGSDSVLAEAQSPYLADLKPVTSDSFKKGPIEFGGTTLRHSLTRDINNCTTEGAAAYALGSRFNTMTGQFGLSDRTPRAEAEIALEVVGDGKVRKSFEFTLNDGVVPATINVRDVKRLELRWTYLNPQLCMRVRPDAQLVIGDAQLTTAN